MLNIGQSDSMQFRYIGKSAIDKYFVKPKMQEVTFEHQFDTLHVKIQNVLKEPEEKVFEKKRK